MSKRIEDSLVTEIRYVLVPGRFVRWDEVSRLVHNLDRVLEKVEADLGNYIPLCVKAKEWDRLAQRIHSAKPAELAALSHYCTESAAKGLAKKDALAAAKLYRALGLRIANAGKSKYYGEALEHFAKARDLYCGIGQAAEWLAVVEFVRRKRKGTAAAPIELNSNCFALIKSIGADGRIQVFMQLK